MHWFYKIQAICIIYLCIINFSDAVNKWYTIFERYLHISLESFPAAESTSDLVIIITYFTVCIHHCGHKYMTLEI